MDPKVEYKREGMKLFDSMWEAIGERVTDLIFRMETLNQEFIRSTYIEGEEQHQEVESAMSRAAAESPAQKAAAGSSRSSAGNEEEARPDPIRRDGPRVGRNDPCPCGSGKKYKQCHMRKTV